jgi:hypothetical protein
MATAQIRGIKSEVLFIRLISVRQLQKYRLGAGDTVTNCPKKGHFLSEAVVLTPHSGGAPLSLRLCFLLLILILLTAVD